MKRKINIKVKPIEKERRITENENIKFYMPINGGFRYFGKSEINKAPRSGKEISIVLSDKNSKLVDQFLKENVVPTVIGENSYIGFDNHGNYVKYTNIYECVIGKCDYCTAVDGIVEGKLPKESVFITFIPKSFKKIYSIPNRIKNYKEETNSVSNTNNLKEFIEKRKENNRNSFKFDSLLK
jgi:hypothetical protein